MAGTEARDVAGAEVGRRGPHPGPGRRPLRVVIRYLLPLVVVAAGVAGAARIYRTAPKARQSKPQRAATLVQVTPVSHSRQRVVIHAMGTVVAAQEVVLQPRVSGEIVSLSPEFIPGGRFRTDETILQIDPRDYQLAVEQSRSEVARANHDVKMELGHQDIARREWELLGVKEAASELDHELALRKPHLEKANAALSAAQAAQEKAELDLKRTTIHAPFNGIITTRNVDLGAQVSPQTQLASLVGTDECWIQVSVPVDRLKWITIPNNGKDNGSRVRVYHGATTQARAEWTGHVLRLLGDLEPQGRMARVLVVVKDPFGLTSPDKRTAPLLMGSYVHADIEGSELDDVISIPRTALRDGQRVWLMGENGNLVVQTVDLAWRDRDTVLVKDGIREGDRLVISDIATPVEGMPLRVEAADVASRPEPGSGGKGNSQP